MSVLQGEFFFFVSESSLPSHSCFNGCWVSGPGYFTYNHKKFPPYQGPASLSDLGLPNGTSNVDAAFTDLATKDLIFVVGTTMYRVSAQGNFSSRTYKVANFSASFIHIGKSTAFFRFCRFYRDTQSRSGLCLDAPICDEFITDKSFNLIAYSVSENFTGFWFTDRLEHFHSCFVLNCKTLQLSRRVWEIILTNELNEPPRDKNCAHCIITYPAKRELKDKPAYHPFIHECLIINAGVYRLSDNGNVWKDEHHKLLAMS